MANSCRNKISDEEIEIWLLTNLIHNEDYELPLYIKNILNGQYEDVLNSELSLNLIESCNNDDFHKLVHNGIEREVISHNSWLCMGVASLLYFIQCNWTGPQIDKSIEWLKCQEKNAFESLSLHDECNTNVKRPELLWFSKIIFSHEILQNTHKSCIWWLFRANLLHQFILNESSGVIFDETEHLIDKINELSLLKNQFCKTLFCIEAAQFYFYYRRIQNSEKYVEFAQETAKLSLNLEGALGKRTKYQHEDKAQLYLKINVEKNQFPSRCCENLPKSLDLHDDVRLEHIEFSKNIEGTQLGAVEEAIILAKHVQLQLSQPKDKLTDEEVKPYLTAVIDSTRNWSLKMASLYHRCILELTDKRAVERSMMQLEHLIHELKNTKVSVIHKMDMFFACGLKAFWVLEQTWAHVMMSLGLVKGALDVFLKLELWEEVINCYSILELKHKAAEIIRQEISKKPTVQLWCLLGDATQDPSHYVTAWKLSNEKSSRAQRHWGLFYFVKKNYKDAIPHLKLSVELNNIQEGVWIRLGFAALQTEDWKLAATAYRRYCALEQSTFEAWNNLANAYIKLGDKRRAWKSLQDATKCNYDSWQVWDNLMIVSIDLGHFAEVIRCYHRILDLKNHHLDIQVLDILTRAILNNINDSDGNPAQTLLLKALELFGRISSFTLNNSHIWRMYGQLTALKHTDIDNEKAAQYLQQAHRAAISDPKWFQQEESIENVLQLCCILAEMYLNCTSDCEVKKKRTLLASAKLSLQGVVKKVKDQEWNNEKILTCLQKVEEYLNTIMNELELIKLTT
ncbi:PREDICTED: tetratricopeptide repeat protein 27 [Dufourea novaeangliae]|uniref:Tetratricopeptide repeat protein 27 n=1 Tax=Dufourea novaeangliae TaxID=178035 RepID=A0A154P1G4_DUFNO|nr:PREDICTED: tetratricopeptide repeat protein 27 [Dufourea novaeangliae]KZC05184.1 Tetratricopeptide repeat protein 27 [Dufourea novaeangliae]